MFYSSARRKARTASIAIAVAILALVPSGGASAAAGGHALSAETGDVINTDIRPMDALGCTPAPGNAGSFWCLTVQSERGSGTDFTRSLIEYTATGQNVCDQTTQWKYLPRTSAGWQYKTVTTKGCRFVYFKQTWDPAVIWLQHSYEICARVKNNITGGSYTGWLCHTMYA